MKEKNKKRERPRGERRDKEKTKLGTQFNSCVWTCYHVADVCILSGSRPGC